MLRAMITDVVLKGVQKHQCSPPSAAPSSRLPSIATLSLPFLGTYPGGETFTSFGSRSKFREHVFRGNKIPPNSIPLRERILALISL